MRLDFILLDIREYFGKIEMKIKRLLNKKFYDSLSENDIPKDTFYCYQGCRMRGLVCPYLDRSFIYNRFYCHYIEDFDILLDDQCKLCGISEIGDEQELLEKGRE